MGFQRGYSLSRKRISPLPLPPAGGISLSLIHIYAGFDFLRAYPCPDDAAGGSLLTDDLCHALAGKRFVSVQRKAGTWLSVKR